jgi:restriction endonuclease S subunit
VTDIDLINTKEENSYRIDFQYNHSSRKVSSELISSCAYPVKYLKDICIERNVSIVLSKNLGGTIIRYTGLANIEPHTGYVEQILTPADSLKSSVKIYKPGDIIFAKMRPNLRKVALMDFSESGYVSSECSVFSVRQNSDGTPIIDPLLLSILLRSNFVYGQIMHLVTGIGRPRINSRDINQIIIPIPPKKNQHKIYQNLLNQRLKAEKLKLEAESLIEMSQNIIKSSVKELVTCFIGDNYEI